ncbi:MAG TPA: RNA polymerase sigma factor [Gammaproteobacteria bacterium]
MHKKAQGGPASALLAAYQSAESGLRQYLLRFVVREQDVEDIVQEAFLRAYEAGQSQEIRAPKSFLFRIARNVALSELSRKSRQLMVHMGDLDCLNVIDDGPTAEQELETQRRLEALGTVIDALPMQCRRVLVMRKIFGFSHREIARRMDISVRTVEKHLARALQRCQEELSRDEAPAPRHHRAAVTVQDE